MVKIRDRLAEIEVVGHVASHSMTQVDVRDTGMVIDEPEARGGTNKGPTPTETLIAAVVGCCNVVLHRLAAANGVTIDKLEIRANAEFDSRGPRLIAQVAVPFPTLHLSIDITTDARGESLKNMQDGLGKFCPLHTVMRAAGTQVTEWWNVQAA